jgi:MATE family multidrug resistance protein
MERRPSQTLIQTREVALDEKSADDGSSKEDGWAGLTVNMLRIAVPTMALFFFGLLNEQVNTIFLGHFGDAAQQAGTGLGNMMQNLFGLCYVMGLLGGLDTLVSQANGAGQHDLCIAYFQRARVISSMQMIWILPIMFFTEPILLAIGQDPIVAANAAQYNMRAGPGIFCIIQGQAVAKFLTNRKDPNPGTYVSIFTSILHVGWVSLFVGKWGMGNAGIGWCNVITWTTSWLLLELYLVVTAETQGFKRKQLFGIQSEAFTGWGEYMEAALPAMIQCISEWAFWEVAALAMGYLGAVALAAHTDTVLCNAVLNMPAVGMQMAAASLVGNKLGENKGKDAKRTCILMVALLVVFYVVVATLVFIYRAQVAALYTQVEAVSQTMQLLLIIASGMMLCGTIQNAMGGMLRGMGKTSIPSRAYVCIYWLYVGPLGFGFAFLGHAGVVGFWLAFLSGQFIVMLVFIAVLLSTDFEPLGEQISAKMKERGDNQPPLAVPLMRENKDPE